MFWQEALPVPNELTPWVIAWVAGLGLCVGSFTNVMGLRLLAGVPLSNPPSHCPVCKTPLAWYENIPVVSYLLQGAVCKHCGTGISAQYPVVELVCGLLFVGLYMAFGLSWGSLLLALLLMNLLSVVVTDWRESLIFHTNSLGLIPLGLAYNLLGLDHGLTTWSTWPSFWIGSGTFSWELSGAFFSALVGVVGAFCLFEGSILLSKWLLGTDGFGHGDTFLLMGVASFLGWELAVLVFILGLLLQGVLAIPLMVWQWVANRQWLNLALITGCFGFAFLPYLRLSQLNLDSGVQVIGLLTSYGAAIGCLIAFLIRVKQQEGFTYMPLGPALVAASLIALFGAQSFLQPLWQRLTGGFSSLV